MILLVFGALLTLGPESYDPSLPPVLNGVSFTAKAGERIGSKACRLLFEVG